MPVNQFTFRNNETIGNAAAEHDEKYLSECFVDTGDLQILQDCQDHRCILVGRTGSGKSALISQIKNQGEHVIEVHPESLALAHIANSNVIRFFSELGINLNLFYRLLWRHIFVIEILKERFDLENASHQQNVLQRILPSILKNKKHEMAVDYLKDWGDSFWQETDYRIKEITSKLEKDLKGAVKLAVPKIEAVDLSSAKKLTEEQKKEVLYHGQEVVSKVQVKELKVIEEFLDDILSTNRQKRYYIVIDKLDEDWVEDQLRFRLIRELIETSLKFTRIDNVKVIVALRNDLLDRVYRFTRDSGFQEEKYRSSSLDLRWSKANLINVLDRRIDKLVKSQYTKKKVTHKDLLRPLHESKGRNNTLPIDYMIKRTLQRPRDLIQFFNECIKLSDGKPMIDAGTLRDAEGNYSRERFRALLDEWFGVYPNLGLNAQILQKKRKQFKVSDLSLEEIENHCLEAATSSKARQGEDLDNMQKLLENKISSEKYRDNLILVFYKVGLIGLQTNSSMPIAWSFIMDSSISESEIDESSRVHVQPTFWRHFGIVALDYKNR